MARLSILTVVTGLLLSSAAGLIVDTRETADLPTLGQIINSITSFGLVKDINVFVTAQSIVDNTYSLNFDVQNLLPLELTIDQLAFDAGLDGTVFATVSHTFASPGLIVPGLSTANSGNLDNIPLPQGSIAALGAASSGKLDVTNLSASIRAISISGSGGLPVPLSGLSQPGVVTTYTPNVAQFPNTLATTGLIQDINIFITPQSLVDNTVTLNFDIQNPLPVELTIDQLGTNGAINGTNFITFSHTFPSPGLVIPAQGSINSGTISNVALPQGALATFGIIPSGKLDLSSLSASTRDLTLNGAGGLPVPLSGLSESGVPTVWSPTPAQITSTLSLGIVNGINVVFSLNSFLTNTVSVNLAFQNLLPFEITVDQLSANAGLNGTTYLTLSHAFPSPGAVVPGLSTVNSGNIDNVPLPQGALATLGIIPFGKLDISNLAASVRALTIAGAGGLPIPLSGLTKSGVPTTYTGSLVPGLPLLQRSDTDSSLPPTIPQIIDALTNGFIQDITVIYKVTTLVTNTVSISFDILNPLPIEFTIDQISADAGLNGTVYASFSHIFPSPGLVVPPLGTTSSGTIDNVALPQGAFSFLGIIPATELDLSNETWNIRALSISGTGGLPVPVSGLAQTGIPATYSFGGI